MLSLIVPYRHSKKVAERFKYFIESIGTQKKDLNLEIVLAEYIDPYPGILPAYIKKVNVKPIKFFQGAPVFFHQSYINNVGALASSGDILLFTNADVIFQAGILAYTEEILKKQDLFVSFFVWYSTQELWLDIKNRKINILKDFEYIVSKSEFNEQQAPRAAFQALRKTSFNKLGGYDVDMWGWGAEEYEFYIRASKVLKVYHSKKYKIVHLWHEPNWGPHHPKRGGVNGLNMKLVKHKNGVWRNPLTGDFK